jgi:hypothetical protein
MKKKYASEILELIHQDAQGLYDIGAIDAARMREFDEMCQKGASRGGSGCGSTLMERLLFFRLYVILIAWRLL